jgi:xylulokinase
MNLRWLRGPAEKFAKRSFTHFLYYGGGAESDAWSQIIADVLNAPVHQLANPQYATCVGAGLLAFERLGMLGFDDFQSRVQIRRVYEPNPVHRAVYDEMSEELVQAFKATQPIFRRLNRLRNTN